MEKTAHILGVIVILFMYVLIRFYNGSPVLPPYVKYDARDDNYSESLSGQESNENIIDLKSCRNSVIDNDKLMRASLDYLLQGLNKSDFLSMNGTGPFGKHLKNYRNPCWLERIPKDFHYGSGAYKTKFAGASHRVKADHVKMMKLFRERSQTRDGAWRLRCLPFVYIIGMYKAGTTDFYGSLASHKLIETIPIKEPYFWTYLPNKVIDPNFSPLKQYGMETFEHYLDLYDATAEKIRNNDSSSAFHPKITVDASTWTFSGYKQWAYHPWNKATGKKCISLPQHISFLSPESRVILLLREPVSWLSSCYNHHKHRYAKLKSKRNPTSADVNQYIIQDLNWLQGCLNENKGDPMKCLQESSTNQGYCHVKYTVYYAIVREWMEVFGGERMLVINSDQYYANRVPVINHALSFLHLPPLEAATVKKVQTKRVQNKKPHDSTIITAKTSDMLYQFLEPWNLKLAAYLNDNSFLWGRA